MCLVAHAISIKICTNAHLIAIPTVHTKAIGVWMCWRLGRPKAKFHVSTYENFLTMPTYTSLWHNKQPIKQSIIFNFVDDSWSGFCQRPYAITGCTLAVGLSISYAPSHPHSPPFLYLRKLIEDVDLLGDVTSVQLFVFLAAARPKMEVEERTVFVTSVTYRLWSTDKLPANIPIFGQNGSSDFPYLAV